MDLTPIRIRGRRKRNRLSENQDLSLKNRVRPWKAARFNQASLQPLKNNTKKSKRDPTLSKFEQLPTEIVQVVFEQCNNINLPLSSFIFARDLSYRNIYLRFAINTLSAGGASDDSATAVSRMLQCKWMTWDIFKDAIQDMYKLHIASISTDNQQQPQAIPAPNFSHPQNQPQLPYLHLTPSIQPPHSLLHGPWTRSTLDFLTYLICCGCSINWTSSSRGETATKGLTTAISTHNARAVALLCSAPVNVVPDTETLRAAVVEFGCNVSVVFHLLVSAVRGHVVARGGAAAGDTAAAMMHGGVHFRDASLWHWAERVEVQGGGLGERGTWLKDALRFAGDKAREGVWDEHVFAEFGRVIGDGVLMFNVPEV